MESNPMRGDRNDNNHQENPSYWEMTEKHSTNDDWIVFNMQSVDFDVGSRIPSN